MQRRSDDLSALMRAANRGDDGAYSKLLTALVPRVRAAVRAGLSRSGRSGADPEDVVQETMLAIHLKRQTWDETQPLNPWVRAIARHKLIDHLRRNGNRVTLDIADLADELPAPHDEQAEAIADSVELMSCLDDRQRAIVTAVSLEGRSARETGDRLGLSEGAVRVALHRALKAMAAFRTRSET